MAPAPRPPFVEVPQQLGVQVWRLVAGVLAIGARGAIVVDWGPESERRGGGRGGDKLGCQGRRVQAGAEQGAGELRGGRVGVVLQAQGWVTGAGCAPDAPELRQDARLLILGLLRLSPRPLLPLGLQQSAGWPK
ncbi:TPA: hypothetical protein BOS_25981 [Bos taurus]|nr:TPA: hypothetical protein BOS_25981 [Bos taurus]